MPAPAKLELSALRSAIAGTILTAADDGYDAARIVTYGGIDKKPGAIVQVKSATDIAVAIRYARDNNLELAVRSGGHSAAGHSTTEGGVVIDVRALKSIEVDPATKTVWAGSGVTAVELTEATEKHHLVVGFGDAGSVGLGGITLGGGVGYLSRNWGMSVDSLLAAEIVTAKGEVLTADADNHPDLFWALRGGGGNFGVVTMLKFALHPLPNFTGGMLVLPATAETIAGFVAAAEAAPEELGTICNVMPAPPMPFLPEDVVGKFVILAMIGFAGDNDAAEAALAPFRALAEPYADFVKPGPYLSMYPPEDPDYHPIAVSRNLFTDSIHRAKAQGILDHLGKSGAQMSVTQIRVLGGAVNRMPAEATAYAHRDQKIMLNIAAFVDGTPADTAAKEKWMTDFASYLTPDWSAAYINFVGDEGAERTRAAYPGKTWDRLRQVKKQYDPQNVFRLNQNIPPAA
jgi:FAD/FMN-containing dehydrogenase